MKIETPIPQQVYDLLFPFKFETTGYPSSWSEHVRKNLIPELRQEVHMYYGEAFAHTIEARFPGLDYALPNHRERLCRFSHHRRLFEVLDELDLTRNEIHRLCDWEGTLAVKRRYELTRGPIRETAGDFLFSGRQSRAARAERAERAKAIEAESCAAAEAEDEEGEAEDEDEDGDEDELEDDEDGEDDELAETELDLRTMAAIDSQASVVVASPNAAVQQPSQSPRSRQTSSRQRAPSSGLRHSMTPNNNRPEAARAAA